MSRPGVVLKSLLFPLLFLSIPIHLPAQTGRTLVSATLFTSQDDFMDVWLNGVRLVDRAPLSMEPGPAYVKELSAGERCFFRERNCLALRLTDGNPVNVAGAFLLKLVYSDGSKQFISSSDEKFIRGFYIDDPSRKEPDYWQHPAFDDTPWKEPVGLGLLSYLASAQDPETKTRARFLSASGGLLAKAKGERHLFRRVFTLEGGVDPACLPKPTATWTPVQGPPTPRPLPTATRTPTPRPAPLALPTATVFIRYKKETLVVEPKRTLPAPARRMAATPTPHHPAAGGQAVQPIRPSIERIVMEKPTARLYFNAADGMGRYKVELLDPGGGLLKVLFDKRMVTETEAWVEWDGTGMDGVEAPKGVYTAVFTKDGKVLRKVELVK